jgi:hypothetical protein
MSTHQINEYVHTFRNSELKETLKWVIVSLSEDERLHYFKLLNNMYVCELEDNVKATHISSHGLARWDDYRVLSIHDICVDLKMPWLQAKAWLKNNASELLEALAKLK